MNIRTLWLGFALLMLTACSSQPEKTSLASVDNADLGIVWRTPIGVGVGNHYSRMTMVVEDDAIFAADPEGTVTALNLQSGDVQWQARIDSAVTAGITKKNDQLFIASRDGTLVSLNALTGDVQWSAPLTSEAVAPAGADDDQVYVHTVDGRITAYQSDDGKQLWSYETSMPVLTVRGTGTPVVLDSLVVTGIANGKVIALDRKLGIPRWDKRLAIPEGRSELERLVDVDGTVVVDGQLLYAASYHGKVAAMTHGGDIRWEEDGSSYFSPVLGLGNLYLTLDNSHVQAFDQASGAKVWVQDALEDKNLGALTAIDNFLAVTDSEGYLYLINQVDGSLAGRRLLRPNALHVSVPNQGEATNWRRMRGKNFGARSPLVATSAGLLVYTNDGAILLLSMDTD